MLIPINSLQYDMEPNIALESIEIPKLDTNISIGLLEIISQINEP